MLAAVALVMMMPAATLASGQDPGALVEEGRAAFTRVGCSDCHTVRGVGTVMAPDLSRVGAKHDLSGTLAARSTAGSPERPHACARAHRG